MSVVGFLRGDVWFAKNIQSDQNNYETCPLCNSTPKIHISRRQRLLRIEKICPTCGFSEIHYLPAP